MNQHKQILIITHSRDNECVENVTRELESLGASAIRFDVDRYPLDYGLTTRYENGEWTLYLRHADKSHNLTAVHSSWFRRAYNLGSGLNEVIDKEYVSASMGEVRQTLMGMLEGLDGFQLSRPSTYRRLDSKEKQLKVAGECGLKIPATCISNDPAQITSFIRSVSSPVIAKMQSAFAIYRNDEEHVVFTNEVKASDLEQISSAQYCPMTFQQKIEKQLELRITVVGNEIFAFSIDSQTQENAKTDWRKEGVALLGQWQPYKLPETISTSILKLMRRLELQYGAIDVIVTPDDQYYFLEVNAAGEFFWLDRLCDHAISKSIARLLVNGPVA